ncbi:MAG TPA: alpha/beta hydrolase [Gaiellaceae bacterium]|jgi:pimeloyl-ACP methyl ester carboxylesterase
MQPSALFLPGWGAPAALYQPGMPDDWRILEPPSFAASGGSLADYRLWLGGELTRRGRSPLGGHSMGAALAICAAAESPELVERLVLVAPAGLPLQKPIAASFLDFLRQAARGIYPRASAARALAAIARAPRAAYALAEEVRALDLRLECARIQAAGIPVLVIGCSTDTLVTRGHAQTLAAALGGEYRELTLAGGHMWMLHAHELLARVLN